MKYEILIYAGKEVFAALDVGDENVQYISMDGNQTHTSDDVSGFYENVLDYFNVDDLSELKAGVRIINGGTSKKNIDYLYKKLEKISDFSLWKLEEILPIAVFQKNMILRNNSVTVGVYDRCCKLTMGNDDIINIENAEEAQYILKLEDFKQLNRFDITQNQDYTELVQKREHEVRELSCEIKKMKTQIQELEQRNIDLSRTNVEVKTVLDTYNKIAFKYVGNVVQFGRYNDESLLWRVLKSDDEGALLISEDIICSMEYSTQEECDWENSDIRKWLNEIFYNESFDNCEKEKLGQYQGDKVSLIDRESFNEIVPKIFREKKLSWWLKTVSCTPNGFNSSASMVARSFSQKSLPYYNSLFSQIGRYASNTASYTVDIVGTEGELTSTKSKGKRGVRPVIYVKVL